MRVTEAPACLSSLPLTTLPVLDPAARMNFYFLHLACLLARHISLCICVLFLLPSPNSLLIFLRCQLHCHSWGICSLPVGLAGWQVHSTVTFSHLCTHSPFSHLFPLRISESAHGTWNLHFNLQQPLHTLTFKRILHKRPFKELCIASVHSSVGKTYTKWRKILKMNFTSRNHLVSTHAEMHLINNPCWKCAK